MLLLSCAALARGASGTTDSARNLFPGKALVYAELHNGRELYESFMRSLAWRSFTRSTSYSRLLDQPGMERFMAGRRFFDAVLRRETVEFLLQCFGETVVLAAWQSKDGPMQFGLASSTTAEVEDGLNQLSAMAMMGGKTARGKEGDVDLLELEKGVFAYRKGVLAFGPTRTTAVKLATTFRAPRSARQAGFEIELDLEALRQLRGKPNTPPDPEEPFGILLAGGWTQILRRATQLHLSGNAESTGFSVSATVNAGTDAVDEKVRPIYLPSEAGPASGVWAGQVGSVSLARDLAVWWKQRRSLFPAKQLAGLAEAENVLNVFFGGPAEEIFEGLAPRFTLVIAPQSFAEGVAPKVPLPGFALEATLTDPEAIGPRLLQAFQNGVVLTNMDRGQKKQGQPLALDLTPTQGDVQLIRAHFPKLNRGDASADEGLRYNLSPTCGVRGTQLVLASAEQTGREVLNRPGASRLSSSTGTDLLVVRGQPLADALDAAMPMMVTNKMLEEGKSREDATRELEIFVAIVRAFDQLSAEISYQEDQTRLRVEIAGRSEVQ